jgi:hypothetical protein
MFKKPKNINVAYGPVPKELHPFFNDLFKMIEDDDEEEDEEMDEDDDCECDGIEIPLELLPTAFIDHEMRLQDIEKALKKAKLAA